MKKTVISTFISIIILCASCSNFLTEYSHDQAYVRSYTDLDELLAGSTYMKCSKISYNFQFDQENPSYPYIHYMADETQLCKGKSSYGLAQSPGYMFGYYT